MQAAPLFTIESSDPEERMMIMLGTCFWEGCCFRDPVHVSFIEYSAWMCNGGLEFSSNMSGCGFTSN
ncbi:hypothetical protein KCU61_g618, partial [Aureobasidium melanogenum]